MVTFFFDVVEVVDVNEGVSSVTARAPEVDVRFRLVGREAEDDVPGRRLAREEDAAELEAEGVFASFLV
jgi:hypothetical protein